MDTFLAVWSFFDSSDEDESDGDDDYFVPQLLSSLPFLKWKAIPKDRHRQKNYINNVVTHFRLDEFKTFFRVDRVSVQCLTDKISSICMEHNISGILCRRGTGGSVHTPLHDCVLMFLWYMASLDKYAAIADRFGTSESTALYSIHNLISFIHDYLLDKVILWPSPAEIQEIKDMYFEMKHFPGVIGFIDGTHISIKKPQVRGIDYYNRKDYFSIVLQGTVREDLRFIDIFCGFPGRVHDARVLRHSRLFQNGSALCGDGHLLGDSAYPNLPWLLTPFRDNGHLTGVQTHYNYVHSSMRSAVERAFGLLKGRFTRLKHLEQNDAECMVKTIVTGCVLHNICILNHDDFNDIMTDDQVPQQLPNADVYDQDLMNTGSLKRLQIARGLQRA